MYNEEQIMGKTRQKTEKKINKKKKEREKCPFLQANKNGLARKHEMYNILFFVFFLFFRRGGGV